jgi:hypothetical protein
VVYRDTVPDFVPSSEDTIGAPSVSTFEDSEAGSSASFFYVVKAVDDSGNVSKSSNRVGKMNRLLSH